MRCGAVLTVLGEVLVTATPMEDVRFGVFVNGGAG